MKSNFYKLKITFAILFGTLLSISPFNPVRLTNPKDTLEVCAQDIGWEDLGTGVACQRKTTCDRFDNTLVDKVTSGEIKIHPDDRNAFLSQIDTYLRREYCVTENVTAISGASVGPATVGGIASNFEWGFCTGDVELSRVEGPNFRTYNSFCCPANHKAVARKDIADGERYIGTNYANFGCCPVLPSDGDPTDFTATGPVEEPYNHSMSNFVCNYENLKNVEQTDFIIAKGRISSMTGLKAGILETSTIPAATEAIESGITKCLNDPSSDYDLSLYVPGITRMPCNFGFIYKDNTNTSSMYKCPNEDGCALIDGKFQVASYLNDDAANSAVCTRCFNPGEPVGADNDGTMLVCDPTAEGIDKVRSISLCNSSVIDTIACLGGSNSTSQNANSEGVGSTNYDLCCACRVQGGVWTGIGCTDTTPAGLITGLIRIVYGVMGGVALIMLIYAGIMYQTGNEANVKKARESIIRTITGLIVLTFSILILRIIGINVLDILPSGSI